MQVTSDRIALDRSLEISGVAFECYLAINLAIVRCSGRSADANGRDREGAGQAAPAINLEIRGTGMRARSDVELHGQADAGGAVGPKFFTISVAVATVTALGGVAAASAENLEITVPSSATALPATVIFTPA